VRVGNQVVYASMAVKLAHRHRLGAAAERPASCSNCTASLVSYVILGEPDIRPALSHRSVTGVACT
jgi:hypothetical protein